MTEVPPALEAPARRATTRGRLAGTTALCALGLGGIVGISALAGFGSDLNAPRVVATVFILLAVSLVAVWPRRTPASRLVVVVCGLLLGVLAWWRVPCRTDGPHLAEAVAWRDAARQWLADAPPDDVKGLSQIQDTTERYSADFPTLFAQTRSQLSDRIAELAARHVGELRGLSATDPSGFIKSAPARRELADSFPDVKQKLVDAEEDWVGRWARYTAVGYTESDMSAVFIRSACRNAEQQLLDYPAVDPSPTRFLEARRSLFRAAHETTEREVQLLHDDGQFDRAFGIALAHQFDWTPSPGLIGANEQGLIDSLRERCSSARKPGGDRDVIPSPRVVEPAPEPRVKSMGGSP